MCPLGSLSANSAWQDVKQPLRATSLGQMARRHFALLLFTRCRTATLLPWSILPSGNYTKWPHDIFEAIMEPLFFLYSVAHTRNGACPTRIRCVE